MAIARDAHTSQEILTSDTATTVSFTIGSILNGYLVAGVVDQKNSGTGATWNGVAMTQLAYYSDPSGGGMYFFGLANPATGTHNFVYSRATSGFNGAIILSSYSGMNASGQPENTSNNTSASVTSLTTAVQTVANNAWTFILADNGGTRNVSAGVSSIIVAEVNNGATVGWLGDSNAPITPPANYSMQVVQDGTATRLSVLLISLAPAAVYSKRTLLGVGS